jgi:hypothetical protein
MISEDLAKKCPTSIFKGNLLRTDDMQVCACSFFGNLHDSRISYIYFSIIVYILTKIFCEHGEKLSCGKHVHAKLPSGNLDKHISCMILRT